MADAATILQSNDGGAGAAGAGAGAGAAGAGAVAGAGAAANSPWYGEVAPDLKSWVETKQYKDPATALAAHHSLEKLIGAPADQIVRLPKADDKAGWDGVWNRLGRPEKADGYELPIPDGQDPAFSKTAAQWFHANGVPKAAAQAIAGQWNEYMVGEMKRMDAEAQTKSASALNDLKAEWGQSYAQREEYGRRALRQFGSVAGLDDKDLGSLESALGTTKMLKLFAGLGEANATSKFSGGEGGSFSMTPAQAQSKIGELKNDKAWATAYLGGDKSKVTELSKLTAIANGVDPSEVNLGPR